jgi:hypothetical protein
MSASFTGFLTSRPRATASLRQAINVLRQCATERPFANHHGQSGQDVAATGPPIVCTTMPLMWGSARLLEPVQSVIIGGHSRTEVGAHYVYGICMVFLGHAALAAATIWSRTAALVTDAASRHRGEPLVYGAGNVPEAH